MSPTYSKGLGSKHATVHLRNTMIQEYTISLRTHECDREYVLTKPCTKHYCRHTIIVGENCMGNNHSVSAKRRGKQANVLFGGREEKLATECVYLVKRSMYGAAWQ